MENALSGIKEISKGARIVNLELIRYLVLENLLPPSLNDFLGRGWRTWAKIKSDWELIIAYEVKKQKLSPIPATEQNPVHFWVTAEFGKGKRRFDWDNTILSPKMIGDGLRKAGMIPNDSGIYIAHGSGEAVRSLDGKNRTVLYYSKVFA